MPVEPERVEGRAAAPRGLRDLEDRRAARPGRSTRAQLAPAALEVGDVADAEADGRRVEGAVLERQREQVALHPLDPRTTLARARARASAREKSRPVTLPPRLRARDREVAGAAAGVEHAVARADDRLGARSGASAGRARRSSRRFITS